MRAWQTYSCKGSSPALHSGTITRQTRQITATSTCPWANLPLAKVSARLEEGRLRRVQARVAQRHDHVVGRNQTHARRRAHLELVDLVPDLPSPGNLGSAQGQRHHAGMPAWHPIRASRTWYGQDTQGQLRAKASLPIHRLRLLPTFTAAEWVAVTYDANNKHTFDRYIRHMYTC